MLPWINLQIESRFPSTTVCPLQPLVCMQLRTGNQRLGCAHMDDRTQNQKQHEQKRHKTAVVFQQTSLPGFLFCVVLCVFSTTAIVQRSVICSVTEGWEPTGFPALQHLWGSIWELVPCSSRSFLVCLCVVFTSSLLQTQYCTCRRSQSQLRS